MDRTDIDIKYKWKLEDIYENDDLWEKDFKLIKEKIASFSEHKGSVGTSGEKLLSVLTEYDEFSLLIECLFTYARMRLDEDNRNPKYQDMAARIGSAYAETAAETSFLEPELTAIPEETLKKYMAETPGLEIYEFDFEDRLRQKKYILSEKEERIMALSSEACDSASEIFKSFNNADIKFPCIKDENGEKVQLTKGNFITFLDSKDGKVRRRAFKALYSSYAAFKNTLAAMYAGRVKTDCYNAKARGYASCIESYLSSDNVDISVYNNLIDVVNANLPILSKYLKLRKKSLGLKKLHLYDLYTPIVDVPSKKYSFEEAWQLVMESVKPLGEEYCSIAAKAFEDRWIDVYETDGKTTGAYSWANYSTHPYILLNWQGTLDDVFTLTHELGHAMHSYYSNANQPHLYAAYRIFVAEVASTVNENLLVDYLLGRTEDENEKAYIINHYLEEFRLTILRQTMFAEFERDVHAIAEEGQSLTCQTLCDMYYALNCKYFGSVAEVDKDIELEWARIPHFYTPFYVYKYATGFSAAVVLSGNILSGDKVLRDKYITFLKSGGSAYPIEILKRAGVDLAEPEPIEKAMKLFAEKLESFEKLL